MHRSTTVLGPPAIWLLLIASPALCQGVSGTVRFVDGRALTGRITFRTATFTQGQGLVDATVPTDTLYFKAGGALAIPVRETELRGVRIAYEGLAYGRVRRVARLELVDVGIVEGTIPAWHEAPGGPSVLVFTRYVEVETAPGAIRRIELPDRSDVPVGDRVAGIEFGAAKAPRSVSSRAERGI